MRISYFDNLKVFLIFLVVTGHLMGQFLGRSEFIDSLYFFINIFHMPLFVFVAGYFSKNFARKGYIGKLAIKLLIPYLIFQYIYTTYYNLYGDGLAYNFLIPRWALWFLISLFFWNLLLIVFSRFKYGLILSVVIGVFAGYVNEINEVLSMSRTFFFFPFFILGYYAKMDHILAFKKNTIKVISVICLTSLLFFIYQYNLIDHGQWLMGKRSYEFMLNGDINLAWLYRMITYMTMFVVSFSIVLLIPQRTLRTSEIGKYTMYIYLLHLFFIKLIVESPIKELVIQESMYVSLFIIPLLIVWFTQSKVVRKITSGLIEVKFLKRKHKTSSV
ncbi:acyltransferase family protein [Salipaludibacillus sp. CF4.18]|uniref:acyltransferase family protein n=1 Tax=Salipaludibacillus sp. CF4.18 TaxID=3373081 RepID=UPI003EE76AFC